MEEWNNNIPKCHYSQSTIAHDQVLIYKLINT